MGMRTDPIQIGGTQPQPPPRLYAASVLSSAPLGNREGRQNVTTRKPGDQPRKMKLKTRRV
jgi:hypothetical protein